MKNVFITICLIGYQLFSLAQEKALIFNIGSQTIYPVISAGIAYNPEHGIAFPKLMVSFQSKEDGGVYIGAQFITALYHTFSKGIHAGVKSKYATIEYSWSDNNLDEGMGAKDSIPYFKSSHNLNLGLKYKPMWARLNVPLRFTSKKGDIREYFKNFPTIKGYPIGFEILYTDNMRKSKEK